MKTITILAILILVSSTISEAQTTNIRINTGTEQPSEPSVCINSKNTDQIIVGTNVNNCYSSNDPFSISSETMSLCSSTTRT